MNDFIFGTLSTEELRREWALGQRRGIVHKNHRMPRDPGPGQSVQVWLTAGPAEIGEKAWLYWTNDGSDPVGHNGESINGFAEPMKIDGITWDTELWGYVRRFSAAIPGQSEDTIIRYRMSLDRGAAGEAFAENDTTWAYYVAEDPTPAWARDAIIYHIFVDRFNPGVEQTWLNPPQLDGFFGGRIRGITEKLDTIQNVGFNTLWLSPIFPSPSHHGYDATNLYSVEPRLGSLEDLQGLIQACHARGMRLLLDFVPNHWSNLHPTFQDAVRNPDSPYREWYHFDPWPEEYNSFFGVKSLPQVNLDHPDARKHMIGAACYWLEQGVDGFRLDYAIGPVQNFWADFRQQTRKINPACWTFGEVVDPPDEQLAFEGLLDGCLDFLLLEAIRQTMAFQTWPVQKFASFLNRHESYFPDSFSRPSFLDNHDMNRFLWTVEGNVSKLKLAALCQFSLSGAPIVYYGTEVGLSQERDIRQGDRGIMEEARLPMLWGGKQNQDLLGYYSRLAAVRNDYRCLRTGQRSTNFVDDQMLVYTREEGAQKLWIVLNLGPGQRDYSPPGIWKKVIMSSGELRIDDKSVGGSIQLEGWSGAILE